MNEKGNIQDIGFSIIILFIFGITAVFVGTIFGEMNDAFQNSTSVSEAGKGHIQTNVSRFSGLFDGAGIFLMVILLVSIIVLALSIRSNPAFAVIGLFVVTLFIVVGAILSNVYMDMTSQPSLINEANDFTILTYVFSNLPIIITVMALLVSIVLYGKFRLSG